MAQTVKSPPAMREIWLRSAGQEDPLEKEMATHSSTLAWKISWTENRIVPFRISFTNDRKSTRKRLSNLIFHKGKKEVKLVLFWESNS